MQIWLFMSKRRSSFCHACVILVFSNGVFVVAFFTLYIHQMCYLTGGMIIHVYKIYIVLHVDIYKPCFDIPKPFIQTHKLRILNALFTFYF